jgi:chromosome segregation ATPase
MPGTYTVTVHVDGATSSESVEIQADPRRTMTMADRSARQDVLMSLHDLAAPMNDATEAAQRLNDQLSEAEDLLGDFEGDVADLVAELEAIQSELDEILDGLGEARRWAGVAGAIQGSSTLPTEDQRWQADSAWDAVPPLVERLNLLLTNRVPTFNDSMNAMGVRPHPGEALRVPRRGR